MKAENNGVKMEGTPVVIRPGESVVPEDFDKQLAENLHRLCGVSEEYLK